MTQYWQLVHGYSPLEAGVRLLPHAATMMIVAPLSARAVEKVGTKRVVIAGLTLITVGLLLLSTIEPESPYPQVISYFVIMAAGMGMTMAPATESVMGSVPREKAGVGSAVNDTTRQVGGALGVAIIGSAVSSVYASRILSLSSSYGLDTQSADAAESSLGGAQRVAAELGDQAASYLASANQIFVDSMAIGMRISAGVVIFAALMAWKFLPARATLPAHAPDETASPEPELEPAYAASTGSAGAGPASVTVVPPVTVTPAAGE
jgi:MFS family permease